MVGRPVIGLQVGVISAGSVDGQVWWQDCGQAKLELNPQGDGPTSRTAARLCYWGMNLPSQSSFHQF